MALRLALLILLIAGTGAAQAQRANPMVPPNWVQEERDSPTEPLRYSSPDGTAWLTLHAGPAEQRPKVGPAGEGERVTYLRKTKRFVAVSGFKGDRIFYRKSNLACQGTRWHHIALEYPAEDKRKMDALVTRVALGMNRFDNDCKGPANATSGGLVRGR
ncbi:MAG TPA: hypothetical protein VFK79_13035 [Xanthobacteraceae bacterium]|nr:hypothetical protein [Xanthobacteraceae bacterium]